MLLVLLDRNDHAKTSCGFNKLKPKEFNKPLSFVCLFLNSWKRKRGNNRDINYNDNDNDFIRYDRPRSLSGLFYQRNQQSQYSEDIYLSN